MTLIAVVSLQIAGMGTSTLAQDQTRDQDRLRDPIFGSQLMSPQERVQYQAKVRTLKTEQERESYRLEHHNQMQERAMVLVRVLASRNSPGVSLGTLAVLFSSTR
ncbi:MAG: hypothetical protein Q7T69_13695 [Rhodoferax sp.]|nr:hypothetical protein [Rhodoferax sp.]